jgi:hypothetical protein
MISFMLSDCCTFNVDDASAWACYYSDFPVERIRDGAVTGWHNDITGASALAVAGARVGLFGGYGPDYDRLALAELGADRAQPAGEYRVVLPAGSRSRQAPRSSAAEAVCPPAGVHHDRLTAVRCLTLPLGQGPAFG